MFECMNPVVTTLSILKGVPSGGCLCPNMINVRRIGIACLILRKAAPVSASAADETTCLRPLQTVRIGPLLEEMLGGFIGARGGCIPK